MCVMLISYNSAEHTAGSVWPAEVTSVASGNFRTHLSFAAPSE
jgi:hypothetical protein